MKKGQVTTYIILGIVIIIAFSFVFFARSEFLKSLLSTTSEKAAVVPPKFTPVYNYVSDCVKEVSNIGLDYVLLQGGYYKPEDTINLQAFGIAYWYKKKDVSPSLNIIGDELAKFVDDNLKSCVFNFNNPEFVILPAAPKTTVEVNDKIIVKTDYPAEVRYKDLTYKLDPVRVEINKNILPIYNASKSVINMESLEKDKIDLTFLLSTGFDVLVFPYEKQLVYSVSGDNMTIMFANEI